jgi:TonB dependent receptor
LESKPPADVNLGFRWDFNLSANERYNRLNRGFDPNVDNPVTQLVNHASFPDLPPLKGGLQFVAVNGHSRRPTDNYIRAVQPRVGAAFMVNSKMVLRGGWGRTYTNPPESYLLNNGFSLATNIVTSLDGGQTELPNVLNNPFPQGVQTPPGARNGALTYVGQNFNVANTAFRTPHVDQFSFGFQYSLPLASKFEATLCG